MSIDESSESSVDDKISKLRCNLLDGILNFFFSKERLYKCIDYI